MEQRKQSRKYLFKKKWFRWWMLPVGASILVWVLFHTVFLAGYVPTESMEPTLKKGSFLIAPRVYSGLERGDVIVFRREGELLVKRIAAVGGDIVDLDKLSYTTGWSVHSASSRWLWYRKILILYWGIIQIIPSIPDIGKSCM